jgi:hypothetical protein
MRLRTPLRSIFSDSPPDADPPQSQSRLRSSPSESLKHLPKTPRISDRAPL